MLTKKYFEIFVRLIFFKNKTRGFYKLKLKVKFYSERKRKDILRTKGKVANREAKFIGYLVFFYYNYQFTSKLNSV